MINKESVRDSVQRYFKAWEENDKDSLLALFEENSVWEDPVGSEPNKGLDQISAFWDQAHNDESNSMQPVIQKEIYLGNEALVTFTMQIRSDQGGMDIEVTDYFKINDKGKIEIARAFWDSSCIKPTI
tara:strand:- start:3107 stop:3490 length:384 start_codon:yes stop_codon:yes gene_type:complete